MPKVVVATRRSELALAQCRAFVAELVRRHPDLEVEELHVITTGDRIVDRPLTEIGGKGLFLKEIEEALLDGRADFAVHSLKDVPPDVHPGLVIGCVPRREDPRDVLVSRGGARLADLPVGATLGTSSLRRALELTRARPDLHVVPLRGNVGTRIRKCRDGEVQATVLARAGLLRLGLASEASEVLEPEVCLPAVGQGSLAIELRQGDEALGERLRTLEDPEAALLSKAERAVLVAVEGDCRTPVAAFAERIVEADRPKLRLRAFLANQDGTRPRREELVVDWSDDASWVAALGRDLGFKLKDA
jgi:hydroxymethylbilane synthase